MALVLADRIQETASAPGTATLTLAGASLGYKTFASGVGSGNTTYYTIVDATANVWEVGIGTVGTGTLSRDTVLSNSSGTTAKINFANSVTVWCDYPAGKSVYLDGSNVLTLSVPEVISVNSASDALRITQTGAGNALVVEDSANPDATPFVVSSSGVVGIGTTTPNGITSNGLALVSSDPYTPQIVNRNKTNDVSAPFYIFDKDRANAIVQNADSLGFLYFRGYDGATYTTAASITAAVDGTPGTNDMPGRLVFSTTADGASSPTERMRIDNAGRVGIGGASYAGNTLNIAKALTGAATAQQVNVGFTINSDVTSNASVFASYPATQAASFTLTNLKHFSAAQGTIGAGSTVTNQYGYYADPSITGATNNYGFYSNIASGTGRYNFYAAGTADNYFAGKVGIGTTPASNYGLLNAGSWTGSSVYYGFSSQGTFQSDVTSQGNAIRVSGGTAATAFTLTTLNHVIVEQGTFGAGSTVSNQIGFQASSSLTGATANYGFYSNIASGTGRWNFYAAGTADNYFAGAVGIGVTASAGRSFDVGRSITGNTSGYGINQRGQVQSDVTADASGIRNVFLQASGFTLPTYAGFTAYQGTVSGTTTLQFGFYADPSLTGATSNYGFYSNIASGTGRYNFYAAGTADNYFAGTVTSNATLQGSAVSASNGLFVNNNTVSANYTIPTNYNASSAGPVTVASGITVTIPSGSNWVVV